MSGNKNYTIAFLIPMWKGGGVERVVTNLILSFKNKYNICLIVATKINDNDNGILELKRMNIDIFSLNASKPILSFTGLLNWLKHHRVKIIISSTYPLNIISLLVVKLFRFNAKIIATEHINVSEALKKSNYFFSSIIYRLLIHFVYPMLDDVISVSKGIKDDLVSSFGLDNNKISVIYNPVINQDILIKSKAPVNHPWFDENRFIPVIIAIGRLVEQKDYPTLLYAFRKVRDKLNVHLAILGEGELYKQLNDIVNTLALNEDVLFLGFDPNPYKWLKRADCLVLSSRWEGLPTVIVEAMYLGVPVVSTNCPSGPNEIIEDGINGILVPVGDVDSLSKAIIRVITDTDSRNVMTQKAMRKIDVFSQDIAAKQYEYFIKKYLD